MQRSRVAVGLSAVLKEGTRHNKNDCITQRTRHKKDRQETDSAIRVCNSRVSEAIVQPARRCVGPQPRDPSAPAPTPPTLLPSPHPPPLLRLLLGPGPPLLCESQRSARCQTQGPSRVSLDRGQGIQR
eukprot:3590355-Rhodomonas_salina.1